MAQSATRYFDVTDDNGVTVHGYVEVHRPTNPRDPDFGNDRVAYRYFQFLNTRDACLIDPERLKGAMRDALAGALESLGISGARQERVETDATSSFNAMKEQCLRNPDKYVSNGSSAPVDYGSVQPAPNTTTYAEAWPSLGTSAGDRGQPTLLADGSSARANDTALPARPALPRSFGPLAYPLDDDPTASSPSLDAPAPPVPATSPPSFHSLLARTVLASLPLSGSRAPTVPPDPLSLLPPVEESDNFGSLAPWLPPR